MNKSSLLIKMQAWKKKNACLKPSLFCIQYLHTLDEEREREQKEKLLVRSIIAKAAHPALIMSTSVLKSQFIPCIPFPFDSCMHFYS